jgi:hypothetical protein
MVAPYQGRRYILRRQKQSRKTPHNFRGGLSKFFSKYPFSSAKNVASHRDISVSRVKDFLPRELGLRKFTRRWVPHSLLHCQKNERVAQPRLLLNLLQRHQTADFNAITTEDESWFRHVYPAGTMYAKSPCDITSCVRNGIGTSKVLIVIFTGTRPLVLKALPKGWKFNQNYFLEEVLRSLSRRKMANRRKKLSSIFCPYGQPDVP